jgi:glycoprotein endo-alpha-1,2-mannosidase
MSALTPAAGSGKIRHESEEHMPVLRLSILAAVVILLSLPSAALAGAGQTSIFYYPWYGTPKQDDAYHHWTQNGHLPPADVAASYYPAGGPYSSADPSVVRRQMRDIAAAGIREVVASWWGWGSPEDQRLPLLLRAADRANLLVAVQIEPYEKWQRTADVLQADLLHLHDLGIRRAYVFKPFDGVVADLAWKDLNAFAAGLGMQMWAQSTNVGRAAGTGFAGVYTYDVVRYGPDSFDRFCAKAHAAGLLCAPSVGPGYDAFRATGDARLRPRRDGAFYDAMWAAAIGAQPDRVTITSYNEWHEGTQIEPAMSPAPRNPSTAPLALQYSSYDGAYGLAGRASERAYLIRTAFWSSAYRLVAFARRLLFSL